MYQQTTALQKLADVRTRIRFVSGGTAASKTISILQLLIDDAQSDATPTLTSVVSETLPHLRKGAMRDFLNILQEHQYFDDNRWNKSDHTYTFETGSQIEFFSADQPGKVRGPRRDRLFVNEGNNLPLETWDQLLVRTKEYAWCDWNPVAHFWAYDLIDQRSDVTFLTLNYRDNEALDARIVADIESHRGQKNWWRVFGEGLLGEVEGRIYTGWQSVDSIPHEARLMRFGLDFGYSQDPAALLAVYYLNGGYILDELLYSTHMSYSQLAEAIRNQEQHVVTYADSADPRGIDEIYSHGIPIMPIAKGRDSINHGIAYVQDQRISVTKRSVNLWREYRGYLWETDKDGHIIDKAQDFNNHLMDAVRYAMESLKPATHRPMQRNRQINLAMPM